MAIWSAPSRWTTRVSARASAGAVEEKAESENTSSAGLAETEMTDVAVSPTGPSPAIRGDHGDAGGVVAEGGLEVVGGEHVPRSRRWRPWW